MYLFWNDTDTFPFPAQIRIYSTLTNVYFEHRNAFKSNDCIRSINLKKKAESKEKKRYSPSHVSFLKFLQTFSRDIQIFF